MSVERTVPLHFSAASRELATHTNLSAVRSDGRVLWVAGDETATVERLVATDDGWGGQETFHLGDLVPLPGEDHAEEADVEGLARDGLFLWAVGSHSLRRRRVKDHHEGAAALRRLATVTGQANRQVLLRLPVQDVDGLPRPVRELEVDGVVHRAASFGTRGKDLRDLLADDEHLAPFLPIPGKDNGLDVEGVAVRGDRVYLGLRGPVLRGWAVVLEVRPHVDPDDPARLRLRELDDGRRYRKHVLDLGGLGVRDLCPQGDDLLVLAGPTMDLDGPVRVHRWHGAMSVDTPTVVRGDALTAEVELPYGAGCDHAEGIGLLGPPEDGRLLVVYDSPAPERLAGGAVLADVVALPPPGGARAPGRAGSAASSHGLTASGGE
jgi:hypothetical protein